MKYNLKLSKILTNPMKNRWLKKPIVKAAFLLCFVAYFSFNQTPIYAQTGKALTKQQKEHRDQVLLQLNGMLSTFLLNVQTRHENVLEQILQLEMQLQNHQAKKKNKKDQALDEQKEQYLKEKIALLFAKEKRYEKMETETISLLSMMQTYFQQMNIDVATHIAQSGEGAVIEERQKIEKNIAELTTQISKQKQEQQILYRPEREQRIREMEQETEKLREEIKRAEQRQVPSSFMATSSTSSPTSPAASSNSIPPEKEKQIKELEKNVADLTAQIDKQKQEQQIAYRPEREQRIHAMEQELAEMEREAIALKSEIGSPPHGKQILATITPSGTTFHPSLLTEKEKQVQELEKNATDLTTQINKQKQEQKVKYSPEREKQIQTMEKELAVVKEETTVLKEEIKQTQNDQIAASYAYVSPEKIKQVQVLEKNTTDLAAQINKQKQEQQVKYNPAREKEIQKMEKELAVMEKEASMLKGEIIQQAQNNQIAASYASVSPEKVKQVQVLEKNATDLTAQINKQKQEQQVKYNPAREKEIQKMEKELAVVEKEATVLKEEIKQAQNNQIASSYASVSPEKVKQVQVLEKNTTDLTAQINKQKQEQQVKFNPEREKEIQAMEKELAMMEKETTVLKEEIIQMVQNNQLAASSTPVYVSPEKIKQMQVLEKNVAELTTQIDKQKQEQQIKFRPKVEKQIQAMEKELAAAEEEAAILKDEIRQIEKQIAQNNQIAASSNSNYVSPEKVKQVEVLEKNATDLTAQINKQKQEQQVKYSPEREKQIQTMEKELAVIEKETIVLKEEIRQQAQNNQIAASSNSVYVSPEKTKQVQVLEKNATDLTAQINKQKQEQQVKYSPEREKQIQTMEKELAVIEKETTVLKEEIKQIEQKQLAQNNQIAASSNSSNSKTTYNQTQQSQNNQVANYSTSSSQKQQTQYNQTAYSNSTNQKQQSQNNQVAYNQKQNSKNTVPASSWGISNSPQEPYSTTSNKYISKGENINSGYYIVFGSFKERNNAEKFLTKLERRYANVVDIGNENIFGMYRAGIGPYYSKEDAVSKRPTDVKNWILRVETDPITGAIAYFEIFE